MLHRRIESWRAPSSRAKLPSRNGTRGGCSSRRLARRLIRALLLILLVVGLVALGTTAFSDTLRRLPWPFAYGTTLNFTTDPSAAQIVAVPPMPFLLHQPPLSPAQAGRGAWFDAGGNVHAVSGDGAVELVTPRVVLRDRTTSQFGRDYRAWPSSFMPGEPFQMPRFASPAERNTLHHASIFISLAAFRDHDCRNTVRNALELARGPHRVYFGISEEREPQDPGCLAALEAQSPEVMRELLWGRGAPAQLRPVKRELSWNDIIAGRAPIVTQDAQLAARATGGVIVPPDRNVSALSPEVKAGREPAVPQVIYLDAKYKSETIECLAGPLETQRDTFLLEQRALYERMRQEQQQPAGDGPRGTNRSADAHFVVDYFRRGKEGPQMQTPTALAGCRAIVRITSPTQARGPTYARYIVSLFYLNQDYFMMIDSHSRFSVEWDIKMIRRVFQIPTRGVLSHYPNSFTWENEREDFNKTYSMTMCKGVFAQGSIPKLGSVWALNRASPELEAFAAAGYLFGDAQALLDVPFDPLLHYIFEGEEALYSARLWTTGWDIYWPAEANIFHNYNRPGVTRYWSYMKGRAYGDRGRASMRMLYIMRTFTPLVAFRYHKGPPSLSPQTHEGNATQFGAAHATPTDSYLSPTARLEVSEERIVRTWPAAAAAMYYGLGHNRSIEDYWDFVQMSDRFVTKMDNEHRWAGGTGLCDKYEAELPQR